MALPRISISATGRTPQELLASAQRALEHSRLIELRLDWLPDPLQALPRIARLLAGGSRRAKSKNLWLQATCRRQENGGRFRGPVSEQLEILRKAALAGCRLVDLEIESAEAAGREAVEALRRLAALIISFHDFHRTPPLEPLARRLRRFPADFYKLVPTATRQSDNCAVLDFLRSVSAEATEQKWIAFTMGEAGVPSRVLALARGSAFVYAASPGPNGPPAAPGQIAFKTLRQSFRAEKLGPRTAVYGLLGNPVNHSVGAAVHNAAFRACGLDAVYVPLLSNDLKDFRRAAERYPLAGFSVTIPHKRTILRLVERMSPAVRLTGAANTVRVRHARWEAINTDVEGVSAPLRSALRIPRGERLPRGFHALIVGNGGAARAASLALKQLRCRDLFITGRNPSRVRKFVRDLGGCALPLERLEHEHFDLMIHATSVGMWPQRDACLLRPEQINAGMVFDLVYNPPRTRLLELARARGCRTLSGLEMFLAQSALQFEYWTGQAAPYRLMRTTAERELLRLQQGRQESAGSDP